MQAVIEGSCHVFNGLQAQLQYADAAHCVCCDAAVTLYEAN